MTSRWLQARWLQSRSVRKFVRSRIALASLGLIGAYVLISVAVFGGLVALEETEERIAAGNIPGLWGTYPLENRFDDQEMYLEPIKRALARPDAAAALSEIRFGHLHVADKSLEQLQRELDAAYQLFEELGQAEDLNQTPELEPRLGELESATLALFAPLSSGQATSRSFKLLLGTDRQGRSILLRAVYSVKVALQVGLVTALISVVIGSLLGAAAGWFGGVVDHLVIWLYTTFSSIPNLVLLVLLAYMFGGTRFEGTLFPLYVSFGVTFWVGPCRVIRGETLKLRELEYVQAATAMGFSRFYILVRHILPNASHLILINFSLLFIGAVKSEVILSFLGLGVKEGPSWGIMISQAGSEVVNGFFWQIGTATAFMFGLVLAFNIVSDALQDAFDPKHAGD